MNVENHTLKEIIDVLDEVVRKGTRFTSDAQWTVAITDGLRSIGEEKGYVVAHPGKWGWLYDLTWLDYSSFDERILRKIPLAVESEWNPDAVSLRIDFNKLLFSRADLCLMIFSDWVSSSSRSNVIAWDFDHQLRVLQASMVAADCGETTKVLFACYEYANPEGGGGHFRYAYAEGPKKLSFWNNGDWR